jgi:allophanate hydrolase
MSLPLHSISELRGGYLDGRWSATEVIEEVLARIAQAERIDPAIWITLRALDEMLADAAALAGRDPAGLPLYGIPFAVKDNIDVAGLPTTAACPEFAHTPQRSAFVVERLVAAGAIVVGKTNLDQFATGLVGARSPYGAPRSPFDRDYISGGSSSGSAVAVSLALVPFALGTDTAGSGRVPAALCNIVGLKPTRGLLSSAGMAPACRSLDCISIFAATADEAATVLSVAAGYDESDAYSRPPRAMLAPLLPNPPAAFRFGVPRALDRHFFGDAEAEALFDAAAARMRALGGTAVSVDLTPFFEAARLLYEGPWVAERTAAVGDFIAAHPGAAHPVVEAIVDQGRAVTAAQTFAAQYRMEALRRASSLIWRDIDVLLLPTAPTSYTVAQIEAEPVRLNAQLGTYTNFVNLLDLSAVAIPAGFGASGRPFGVTLMGPAHADQQLLALGDAMHRAAGVKLGASGIALPPHGARRGAWENASGIDIMVVGAHLAGLALNRQLGDVGGILRGEVRTAPRYRLHVLTALSPVRPGMMRVEEGGVSVAGEVWRLPDAAFGAFVARIDAPHSIGKVELDDGRWVSGFLCDPLAMQGQPDISRFGGWRAWQSAGAPLG